MTHIGKAFNVVNEAEVDIFLEFPCFLYDPMKVDSLISGSSAISKSSFYICKNLVLEKTLESPLECKEIKPLNPKGNQFWIFIGSTDAEAEAPVLWPSDPKSQLTGKEDSRGWDG